MKNIILLSLFSLILTACLKKDDKLIPAELDSPSVMIVFCQASIEDTLRIVEYGYDNNKLITEASIQNGEVKSKTTFGYNSDNLILSEVYLTDWKKTEKTFVYNENNQLINILYKFTDYDTNGQITDESESEAPREYENNQLIKEWEYWGGFNTYEYKDGKIATKIDYTKNGEEHHFTYYKYSEGLLIEEKKETKVGGLIYSKTYTYDSQNKLIQIRDGDNIIEKNDYIDNKLIEKKTFYFGIDPGFDVCYGSYLFKYKY